MIRTRYQTPFKHWHHWEVSEKERVWESKGVFSLFFTLFYLFFFVFFFNGTFCLELNSASSCSLKKQDKILTKHFLRHSFWFGMTSQRVKVLCRTASRFALKNFGLKIHQLRSTSCFKHILFWHPLRNVCDTSGHPQDLLIVQSNQLVDFGKYVILHILSSSVSENCCVNVS